MATSQKCKKGSTKHATYSVHLFWKQDLNVLPNSADDLNVHKSPSVSRSSTFDIIADNFFSFDNRTALSKLLFLNLPILILILSQHLSINLFLTTFSSSKTKCCLASSTRVQGKTLVSNSTSFSDTTSKSFLSTVSQINLHLM